jgi:hypothetical protein
LQCEQDSAITTEDHVGLHPDLAHGGEELALLKSKKGLFLINEVTPMGVFVTNDRRIERMMDFYTKRAI